MLLNFFWEEEDRHCEDDGDVVGGVENWAFSVFWFVVGDSIESSNNITFRFVISWSVCWSGLVVIVNVVDSVFWLTSCPSRVPRYLGFVVLLFRSVGREIWCGPGIITEIQTLRCKVQYLSYGNFLKFISPIKYSTRFILPF